MRTHWRHCTDCGSAAVSPAARCARCLYRSHNRARVRVFGGVMVALGAPAALGFGLLALALAALLLDPAHGGARLPAGETSRVALVAASLAAIAAAGAATAAGGLWRLALGRRSLFLFRAATFLLAAGIVGAAASFGPQPY